MRKILPLLLLSVTGCSHGLWKFGGELALGATRSVTRSLARSIVEDAIYGDRRSEPHGSAEPCIDAPPRRRATERELTSIDRRPQL